MKIFFRFKNKLTFILAIMLGIALVSSAYGAKKTKPTIDSVFPISGPSLGGTLVVINGSNFEDGTVVDFNGVPLATVFVSDTTLNVTTSLSAKGFVDVGVTNTTGENSKLNNGFEFIHPGDGSFVEQLGNLPTDNDFPWDADSGDIDNDGDIDYVVANSGSDPERLYLNNGDGTFIDASNNVPFRNNPNGGGAMAIELGDLDGDSDIDILVVVDNDQDELYLNNGDNPPTFVDATTNIPTRLTMHFPWGACLGDLNQDNYLDIYVAVGGSRDILYLNDSANPGTFIDASAALPADSEWDSEDCAIGDANGDGLQDIFVADWNWYNRLYQNNGDGTFSSSFLSTVSKDGSREIALADFDGDGDLDAAIANHSSDQNSLVLNDGSGNYTDATANLPVALDDCHDVKASDVDGDADVDLIFSCYLQNTLYLNDGSGHFTDATSTQLPVDTDESWDVIAEDMDGDMDIDLIFINDTQDRLYLNTP